MLFEFLTSSQRWVLFFMIMFSHLIFSAKAKPYSVDTTSYENLWQKAKCFAYAGERVKAKALCVQLSSRSEDPDASVLLGRLYAWEGQYDSARTVLRKVLSLFPAYYDA
jgi:uncharacterized protein HemY